MMNKKQPAQSDITPSSPIKNKVGSVFVPVRNIEKSRSWYCQVLGIEDLKGSFDYMKALGVNLVTKIEHDHWFVVKDPDGNKLMICLEW